MFPLGTTALQRTQNPEHMGEHRAQNTWGNTEHRTHGGKSKTLFEDSQAQTLVTTSDENKFVAPELIFLNNYINYRI